MTMLQWETVHGRDRAVSGNNEFRVFCDAASSGSQNRPWILVIREIGEDGVHTHVFHKPCSTAAEAKEAAQHWKGQPLK